MIEIIHSEYVKDYVLKLFFSDNKVAVFDFTEYTKRNGLYSDLKEVDFFRNFEVDKELGTIVWSNGLDIAPDTLYNKCFN
jgi:hypothetical protein